MQDPAGIVGVQGAQAPAALVDPEVGGNRDGSAVDEHVEVGVEVLRAAL